MTQGVPPKATYTRPAGRKGFTDAGGYLSGEAYRADLRGDTSVGLSGRREGEGPNPRVHSKAVNNYGPQGSRLPNATYKSTGEQPAPREHDGPPSSLPVTHRQPGKLEPRHVGHATDGSGKFTPPSHPNTDRADATALYNLGRQSGHEFRAGLSARAKNEKPTQQVPDNSKLNRR